VEVPDGIVLRYLPAAVEPEPFEPSRGDRQEVTLIVEQALLGY
jgi:hypothetical protein